jgi:hypothetical protein
MLEVVKSDEQIYSKVAKLIDMARAERVKAWIKDFTTEGKRPRARLVIEADGAATEFSIRLHEDNEVELRFDTTDREEAERGAALLRAVGVRAEVKKTYHKSRGRDVWHIDVTTYQDSIVRTRGAFDALMRLELICEVVGLCSRSL